MTHTFTRLIAVIALTAGTGVVARAATLDAQADLAVRSLKAGSPGAIVSVNPATGKARFVRIAPATQFAVSAKAGPASKETTALLERSAASFLDLHGAAFGLRSSADLTLDRAESDDLGQTHVSYTQRYAGLPVFGSHLKVHFDVSGRITVINGTVVPDIGVSAIPSRTQAEAEASAVKVVNSKGAAAKKTQLLIYREGLMKGTPGANRLAYEVEVWHGNQRDFLYVDAHTNKLIDRISGTPSSLHRRAFDAEGQPAPGPNYPNSPFWVEGQRFPTGNDEADNMIRASKETYDLFWNAFRRDSYDGAGATMDSVFNRGDSCPNASWNGVFISFCPGLTTDDVTGHEWGHAYTEYTDNLIYAWQSGALNEASSDIFGEVVDRLNSRDEVGSNRRRAAGAGVCSVHTPQEPIFTVNAPAAIAGVKESAPATFGEQIFDVTGNVVLVNDGSTAATPPAVGTTTDGCQTPFVNAAAVAGKIALIDRGACGFSVKVKNAEDSGAIAAVIGNNTDAPPIVFPMGPTPGFTPSIPSVMISLADTNAIKARLASRTVTATMERVGGTDNSARWLMGEDSTAPGLIGALRDMWEPNCYGNPNRVSDPIYHCEPTDGGGVHINSGVDNRAFSLLVDGDTHNGVTVNPIGMTKATHIWYRAKVVYQYPATTFAEHADALVASCEDLIGRDLRSLATGAASGERITAGDCRQVGQAMRAVDMRLDPAAQCGFESMLAKNPPQVCPGGTRRTLFADNFENPAQSSTLWTRSKDGTTPDFTERRWTIVGDLPEDRGGKAFFGPDFTGGTCAPGGDETAVLRLTGPAIQVPPGKAPRVVFDHWMSSEPGWDGGNLKVSVNGGAFQLVPPGAFVFNAYNDTIFPPEFGNSNPLAGEPGFTGADGGSTSGSWYRSIVDLTGIAAPGDSIRLRFAFGNDGCFGWLGWYVDNVKVQQCR